MKVYRDYTQAELDAQYEQRTLVPDVGPYIKRWAAGTAAAKTALRVHGDIAYGDHDDERLDLYGAETGPESDAAPVLIFLHGGAWRMLSKDESGYLAPVFVEAGAMVAAVNFSNAPAESLEVMAAQVTRAVRFLRENVAAYGGDPDRIYLAGHSSGAHLAAMALQTERVAGAVFVSGAYDLAPIRLSARNDYLHLDDAAALRNSPLLNLQSGMPPAIVAWGGRELDEFQRQGGEFAESWEAQGASVDRVFLPDANHFDMGDAFADPTSRLVRAMFDMMDLA
jgi:arylformamidase